MPKNWGLQNVVLEKTPASLLDLKEIKPVKGNQPWILVGRTDSEAEALVFWSSDANSRLLGKVPDAGKDWGQKEKRASEDEVAGWHHQCNGHELGQTSEDGEGQGGLACCSSWVSKSRTQLGSWTPPPPVAGNLLCKWILKCLWSNILLCDKRHINTSLVNNVFKWPYYPKQSTDLMLSLSNYPWHFS